VRAAGESVAPPEPQPGLAGPVRGAPWTSAAAAGSRFSPDPTTGPTTPRRFSISHAAHAAGPVRPINGRSIHVTVCMSETVVCYTFGVRDCPC
jgi:hypothetical protein